MSPLDPLRSVVSLGGFGDRPRVMPQQGVPDFEALLRGARDGSLTSGGPVQVADGFGVELSTDDLTKLSALTDQAGARGADSLAVVLDGAVLRIDVATRTVVTGDPLSSDSMLDGVDALAVVADEHQRSESTERETSIGERLSRASAPRLDWPDMAPGIGARLAG